MKQFQKFGLIIIVFTAMFVTSSLFSGTSQNLSSERNLEHQNKSNKEIQYDLNSSNSTEKDFAYYRDTFLDLCNVSLEYYENLSKEDLEYANNHICAMWGFENGTYTEEEARNMVENNSPVVSFLTYTINPITGLLVEVPSDRATPESIIRHDDEEFRVGFSVKMESALGEHISRIDAFLYAPNERRLYFDEVEDIWGLGRSMGDYYDAFLWGSGHVDLEIHTSTYTRDISVEFDIVIQWHKLVLFWYEDRTMHLSFDTTYKIELELIPDFPFFSGNYVDPAPIILVDDDTTKPDLIITDSNLHDGDYLYDGDPYLYLSGSFTDLSGVQAPIFELNGLHEIWREFEFTEDSCNFDVHFSNPRELGEYYASIAVYDNDLDVGSRDREFINQTKKFSIVDDDTSKPSITIERILGDGTDGNPGFWWIWATDESGINDTIIDIEGLGRGSLLGYYEVNAHPFWGDVYIEVFDNDQDRGPKDREFNVMTKEDDVVLVDDDNTPPIVQIYHVDGTGFDNSPGFWHIYAYDLESGIDGERVQVKIDGIEVEPGFIFSVPSTPGTHTIEAIIPNADRDYEPDIFSTDTEVTTMTHTVTIQDDDPNPPYIGIMHSGGATDADPGIWYVSISDQSGISYMQLYIDDILVPIDEMHLDWSFEVPNSLGYHNIRVYAIDGDSDYPGDMLSSSISSTILIEDDDFSPPIIDLLYFGSGTDNDPGGWTVNVYDPESGIESIEVFINDILVGNENGNYYLPNTLGNYMILVVAKNADFDRGIEDQETFIANNLISIIDDDTTSPEIEILYSGSGNDGDFGYWTVSAEDFESGIASMEVFIDNILIGSTNGEYLVPDTIGDHIIRVIARNNDLDRGVIDQDFNEVNYIVTIVDDDSTPPIIEITYCGSGTDGDLGYWIVNAFDLESGIDSIEIYIDEILIGTTSGNFNVPNQLGDHIIRVIATNADFDRGIEDMETEELTDIVTIIDDDPIAPLISNIEINNDINQLNISFEAYDFSGIGSITMKIDGRQIYYYEPTLSENYFEIILSNEWIMEIGEHVVFIDIQDGDNDRPEDALHSHVTIQFTTTFEDMNDYVLWEIDEFIQEIQASPDELWGGSGANRKKAMIHKLMELNTLVINGQYVEAYDKLLHDIKPKLTSLKSDENGVIFGNGIFNNYWYLGDNFLQNCDNLLIHLQVLINEHSVFLLRMNVIGIFSLFLFGWIFVSKKSRRVNTETKHLLKI
ncbi:MAG: hypothetical protein JW776_14675 [Candidatus Lokiarchaeota archaeon]|nr:hypothetical protein [Candidatus Lokiarchaeota archaeon]